jgi:putative chitinase
MEAAQLAKLGIDAKWLQPLNDAFEKFQINTPRRQAAFLGQCMVESGKFTHLSENLNYSAARLVQVWPAKFRGVDPAAYGGNPEKLANRVYAGIIGNGDEASGDGYRFRGRGVIQLTGRANYKACGDGIGKDLTAEPDYVATPEGAIMSAAWYFKSRGLNELADNWNLDELTRRVNAAKLGLVERKNYSEQALKALTT